MSDKPFTIIDLIEAVGVEKVRIQFIDACATGMGYTRKNGTVVKFSTDVITPEELLSGSPTRLFGIVLWIPRKDRDRIVDEFERNPQ